MTTGSSTRPLCPACGAEMRCVRNGQQIVVNVGIDQAEVVFGDKFACLCGVGGCIVNLGEPAWGDMAMVDTGAIWTPQAKEKKKR